MKTTSLFALSLVLLSIFSCGDSDKDDNSNELKTPEQSDPIVNKKNLIKLRVDDISSFNLTTREIKFLDEDFSGKLTLSTIVNIYLNDELLLEYIRVWNGLASWLCGDLVLVYDLINSAYYLKDSMPEVSIWPLHTPFMGLTRNQVQQNINNRKKSFDEFVDCLYESGKLIR